MPSLVGKSAPAVPAVAAAVPTSPAVRFAGPSEGVASGLLEGGERARMPLFEPRRLDP